MYDMMSQVCYMDNKTSVNLFVNDSILLAVEKVHKQLKFNKKKHQN